MKKLISLAISALLLAAGATQAASDAEGSKPVAPSAQSSTDTAEGEVRKVDMDAKKLTIKHGELKNLGMPSMTMVFQVKDPAMLGKVKAGDKVLFTVEKIGNAFTVISLEAAK